jgi:hypothetical protein
LLALTFAVACGRGNDATSDSTRARSRTGAFSSASGSEYTAIALTSPGRVTGTVTFGGELPADTIVRPTADVTTCGSEFTESTIETSGSSLAGAVVWLDGVRSGKPLPLVRRYDIINEGCLITPRVQAAIVGGTLNVRSRDPVTHRTRLIREGEAKPIALVSETDEGQVVPLDHALEVPGQVEIRCDFHPWTRAFIAVFDHPYFAVTGRNGGFAFDSVPPGKYTLMAWHERLGTTRRNIVVEADGTVNADVELRAGGR